VLSEFLGESEAALRAIFAAARAVAPAVVFIDEIDALAPAREGGAAGSLVSGGGRGGQGRG
jgi:transitional endoplasmic reticulum ATPase